MKVQTDTRIDVVRPTHQAYVTLLDDIFKEYLALKAQSTPDDAEEAPAQAPEVQDSASMRSEHP
jgi:hypothetical protein